MKVFSALLLVLYVWCSKVFAGDWEIAPDDPGKSETPELRFNVSSLGDSKKGLISSLDNIGTEQLSRDALAALVPQLDRFFDRPSLFKSDKGSTLNWSSIDSHTSAKFVDAMPDCAVKPGEKLTSRAQAWERAYQCLINISKDKDKGRQFVGDDSILYVIEPVLDLDEGKSKKERKIKRIHSLEEPTTDISSIKSFVAQSPGEPVKLSIEPPSPVWPAGESSWHLGEDYSQLTAALNTVRDKAPPGEPRISIAHLDTGYARDSPMLPPHFQKDISATCVKDGKATPVCTPNMGQADFGVGGLFNTPGHGTGTLANLAGDKYVDENGNIKVMGGNPDANVFSVRIHDSVIHLNSRQMASGIDYAVEQGADVITLSAGGLPSARLAAAVSNAYYKGTPIFAATGDFYEFGFFIKSWSSVVYPARYKQVMGVTGVTAENKSYGNSPSYKWLFNFKSGYLKRFESWTFRGSYGPEGAMANHVISAYAPNITRIATKDGVHFVIGENGSGTSHATPQVAAAASLWLQLNRGVIDNKEIDENKNPWRRWEKSEAVYQALAQSSNSKGLDVKHFGVGVLKADDALGWTYDATDTAIKHNGTSVHLSCRPPASNSWADIFELLTSVSLPIGLDSSLRLAFTNALFAELSQVAFTSHRLQSYIDSQNSYKSEKACGKIQRTEIDIGPVANMVSQSKDASPTLKRALMELASKNKH